MTQTMMKQSFEIAREIACKEMPGWVPIACTEKKCDPSWGEKGRCFLIALRKTEHASIPFDDTCPDDIPNRVVVFMWQGENNYIVKEMQELRDFSDDALPDMTINAIMSALLEGMAQQN